MTQKTNPTTIIIQMKKYFANQDEIKRLKLERRNFSAKEICVRQKEQNGLDCIKYSTEYDIGSKGFCEVCEKKHSFYILIQKLSRENGGILRSVKNNLTKNFNF